MRFTKMHGIGNDYVCVDCFEQRVEDPSELARKLSDRHFGIGCDGLLLIMPSRQAQVRMRMFNTDGSEGEMCGNGIRCVAKYAYERGRACGNPITVETLAGIKTIGLTVDEANQVTAATVDMGEPILAPREIPVAVDDPRAIEVAVEAGGRTYQATCVSMGNPHAVIYVDDVGAVELERMGPLLENHELFPARMNVHFVQVRSPQEVSMRTWERGSGATLACGTGASAVCVAGVVTGRTGRRLLAHLPGGELELNWRESDGHVLMSGPVAEAFSGEWPECMAGRPQRGKARGAVRS